MGSATTAALVAVNDALVAQSELSLELANELFSAASELNSSRKLREALGANSVAGEIRGRLANNVFASFSENAKQLLTVVANQRWSDPADIPDALTELAIRSVSLAQVDVDVEQELFQLVRLLADNPELELALSDRFAPAAKKQALATQVAKNQLSDGAVLIFESLAAAPKQLRLRQLLLEAMRVAADAKQRTIAIVTSAVALSPVQSDRIEQALAKKYARKIKLNNVVDPLVIGGLRVQVADDVIDGSVSTRLNTLRQRLAS